VPVDVRRGSALKWHKVLAKRPTSLRGAGRLPCNDPFCRCGVSRTHAVSTTSHALLPAPLGLMDSLPQTTTGSTP
jgi:hypothetical protein